MRMRLTRAEQMGITVNSFVSQLEPFLAGKRGFLDCDELANLKGAFLGLLKVPYRFEYGKKRGDSHVWIRVGKLSFG